MSSSSSLPSSVARIDSLVIGWMRRYGPPVLHFGLAVVFIWFGALKI